jgi:hypothetical protein
MTTLPKANFVPRAYLGVPDRGGTVNLRIDVARTRRRMGPRRRDCLPPTIAPAPGLGGQDQDARVTDAADEVLPAIATGQSG